MFRALQIIFGTAVVIFLLMPIFAILPLAFTSSVFLNYPIPAYSMRWIHELTTADVWRMSIINSLIISGGATVLATVLGTLAALGGTLAAYKFFDIQVSNRFRKIVIASMFGFVAVSLLDFILSFFGNSFGFNGFGPLGLISSVIGVVIAVFMLILDFDFVERGIAAGLPERESWRAAFGLTVTIVWLYIELLRILAILRGND